MPRAEIPGASIHYERQGVGDPLLLIPCLASDNGCWAFQLPAYAERFTCVAVDLPGSGESPVSDGRPTAEQHAFMTACMESWRTQARAAATVADFVVEGVFPWVFTPEMYADRPEVLEQFAEIVRTRPPQSLEGFLAQSQAVLDDDASAVLRDITAPTLVTFGARDLLTSTRFAAPLVDGIPDARLVVFDHLSHWGFNEDPEAFTAVTLAFLEGTSR